MTRCQYVGCRQRCSGDYCGVRCADKQRRVDHVIASRSVRHPASRKRGYPTMWARTIQRAIDRMMGTTKARPRRKVA